MLSSEAGQRAVEEYLDTCQLGYRWHVLERGRRGADNRQRYVAVLSQPTAVKPVPDAVVRVNFRVSPDLSGQPAVEYKVENENMIWRTGGGRSVLTDAVIDRVIERKRKLAEELDMGDAFTRTRLMAPEAVTEAASAADPAPAPEDAPAADGAADLSTEDPSELEERLASLFRDADRDHGGTLSHAEFAALMRDAGLGLDDDQLFYLLAQADEDGDGALSYREFARLGAEMVLAMRAHQEAESAADAQEREAEAQARMVRPERIARRGKRGFTALCTHTSTRTHTFTHAYPGLCVAQALAEMDAAGALEGLDSALADGEGGRVELSALPDALASPRVGLAPGEVRMVMAALQGSAGDTVRGCRPVSRASFTHSHPTPSSPFLQVDVADVRSAVLQAKQAAARARTQAGTLSEAGDRILSLLREADEEGQGTLPTSAVAAALGSDSRLMLSRPQVMVLIAQCGEAARREGGGVDVEQFAREAGTSRVTHTLHTLLPTVCTHRTPCPPLSPQRPLWTACCPRPLCARVRCCCSGPRCSPWSCSPAASGPMWRRNLHPYSASMTWTGTACWTRESSGAASPPCPCRCPWARSTR